LKNESQKLSCGGTLTLYGNDLILSYPDGENPKILKGHTEKITGAMELRDGRLLSWSEDKTIKLWEKNGEELFVFEGHMDEVRNVHELPEYRVLSWSSSEVIIWNYKNYKKETVTFIEKGLDYLHVNESGLLTAFIGTSKKYATHLIKTT